ncbi:MAG: hypothetical protein FWG61_03670 [Firmicutes bacterium]|nr:hypothetical protein [Bacillota bacterium]
MHIAKSKLTISITLFLPTLMLACMSLFCSPAYALDDEIPDNTELTALYDINASESVGAELDMEDDQKKIYN